MQTYYQKHRQIKAFQFDGTWRQIITELPYDIIDDMLFYILDIEPAAYVATYDEDNHIETLTYSGYYWPMHNVKTKGYRPKYQLEDVILHRGDYVSINYNEYRHVLAIHHRKSFESHWRKKQ